MYYYRRLAPSATVIKGQIDFFSTREIWIDWNVRGKGRTRALIRLASHLLSSPKHLNSD